MSKEPQETPNAKALQSSESDSPAEQQDYLQAEEIVVEEMAIDGICGVY